MEYCYFENGFEDEWGIIKGYVSPDKKICQGVVLGGHCAITVNPKTGEPIGLTTRIISKILDIEQVKELINL